MLVDQQVVPQALADRLAILYDDLNGFVHGSERRLINKGQYTRSWMGHTFVFEDFQQWCSHVKEAVFLGIHLLRVNLTQWDDFRSQRTVVCPICHNVKGFDEERFSFGGEEFINYRCRVCSDVMTHNHEGRQAYGQSFGGEIVSYQYS